MLNHHLKSFIAVADCGSVLKASEQMYISATALTKQINLLESHLELKLFHRTNQGVTLTEAGKLIYEQSKKLIQETESILEQAHKLELNAAYTIHIGFSLMNPSAILMEQWSRASSQHPNLNYRLFLLKIHFLLLAMPLTNSVMGLMSSQRLPIQIHRCLRASTRHSFLKISLFVSPVQGRIP